MASKVKPIHPRSRKAEKLTKQEAHEKRKQKHKHLAHRVRGQQTQKLLWFQETLKTLPPKDHYTPAEICDVIAKYLERYDTEIDSIADKGERFKARPPSARHEVITSLIAIEKREFITAGFEVPDLTDIGNVKRFREWSGDPGQLDNIRVRRFKPVGEMILLGGGEITATGTD